MKRIWILFLLLFTLTYCLTYDSQTTSEEERMEKNKKTFKPMCLSAMALYFGTCISSTFDRPDYCSNLYGQCTLLCALAEDPMTGIGCGF
ncbi:hypothetical protein AB3N59_19335 [Leptospira sp. WS92.C1]